MYKVCHYLSGWLLFTSLEFVANFWTLVNRFYVMLILLLRSFSCLLKHPQTSDPLKVIRYSFLRAIPKIFKRLFSRLSFVESM